jgi:hypothetical protein
MGLFFKDPISGPNTQNDGARFAMLPKALSS